MKQQHTTYDIIIIGGGAAGFFTAINIAEQKPHYTIAILERGKTGLQKVKISGGGRCNVTHAEFTPSELVTNYPRGEKELLGPFHTFMTGDTIAWFENHGVDLKIEDDGRMFPVTDSSKTIINCFLNATKQYGIDVLYSETVKHIQPIKTDTSAFKITTQNTVYSCKKVVVATGSNPKMWQVLQQLHHNIVPPVPSLFTFNCTDKRIKNIPGVVAKHVEVTVLNTKLTSVGPLLITHVGFSAPAILKLSAFGALQLAKMGYKFNIEVNFIVQSFEDTLQDLKELKLQLAKKTIINYAQFNLPKRLWKQLVLAAQMPEDLRWADATANQLQALASQLTQAVFAINGKSTFKEEFVTAGGVHLKDINFKTFESKHVSNLYFAGETLNIDAVTGGFNFQNAWTSGFIVAQNI